MYENGLMVDSKLLENHKQDQENMMEVENNTDTSNMLVVVVMNSRQVELPKIIINI
jgi:hypothetical protein